MNKFATAALASILVVLTGCTGGSPVASPTPTETVTVTVTPTPSGPKSATPDYVQLDKDGKFWSKYKLKYAASHNRLVLFQDYEVAKFIVARQLEAGFFGKPQRYNSDKVTWKPGMFGWGGITVNTKGGGDKSKPAAYAWVWFRDDGSIDYSRGVTSMLVDAGPKYKRVMIFDQLDIISPTPAQKKLKYQVALDQFGDRFGNVRITCVDGSSICMDDGDGMNYTGVSNEMTQLDEDAIKELNRSMTALFGSNWRTM